MSYYKGQLKMNKYKFFGIAGYIVANTIYYTLRKNTITKKGYILNKQYVLIVFFILFSDFLATQGYINV